jgi:hypothetical protein
MWLHTYVDLRLLYANVTGGGSLLLAGSRGEVQPLGMAAGLRLMKRKIRLGDVIYYQRDYLKLEFMG